MVWLVVVLLEPGKRTCLARSKFTGSTSQRFVVPQSICFQALLTWRGASAFVSRVENAYGGNH
jgi:hypothetical protein